MKFLSLFSKTKYSFEGKKDYENVLVLLYRHWFTLFANLFAFALLLLPPVIIYVFLGGFLAQFNLASLFYLLISLYILVWWLSLFYQITMYLLDTWIVTDHRIIDNEQHGFFNRTFAEMHLSRIQDVAVKIQGLIPTFFDYGDIEIQTAGTQEKFIFKQVSHPNVVRELIMKAQSQFISTHPGEVEIHEQL